MVVGVDYGQVVSVLNFKLSHHILHAVVDAQLCRNGRHDLLYVEFCVQFGAEHDVSDFRYVHLA